MSLFLTQYLMLYAICMPSNTKDLAMIQTMAAYGNRQSATAFARANNSDLLRSLNHLMETRLYSGLLTHGIYNTLYQYPLPLQPV